jgi:hypothetical protein
MTDVPDYVLPSSATTQAVHTTPPNSYQWQNLSQEQLNTLRSNLITSIIQLVVQALTGTFLPGGGLTGAMGQLTSWATGILNPIFNLFGGSTSLGQAGNFWTSLLGLVGNPTGMLTGSPTVPALGSIPILGPVLGLFGGATNATQAGNFWTSLLGLVGNPTGMLTGSPTVPGLSSIPLIGGLFSGGNILGSLIPGLDASKITSGSFPMSMITSLSTLLGGFGTGSSILTQLIGLVPGTSGGLSGLTGFGSILTDLFGIVGSPTGVGSGSPTLPGVGSIPLLGGLLSGGSILGSLIPSLDASKITTGSFLTSLIPNLAASKITSGIFGSGLIPSLPASQITSGIFGAGLIPSIDGSKIGSGTVGSSFLPSTSWFSSIPASSLTGTITETVTGLGTLRDSFLNGLFNQNTSGYTNAQAQQQAAVVAQQAASAQAAAAAANATLAAQAAQASSNNSGGGFYQNISASGTDGTALSGTDFASTGPTSGDLCIRGNNSYIGIKSGAATNTVGYFAILNYTYTTDNQRLEVALGDQGSYDSAYTTLYMHCDTSHTVGAYCRIANDQIVIGSYTRSGGTYTYTPFSGGTYNGNVQQGQRAGFRNNGTTWSILVGGNSVLNVTNSSVTFSGTRRSAAISMDRQHSSGFFGWGAADYDSFRIASISMADYVIPTYIGSGARITRTSTTQIAASSSGSQLLPTSFFGNTDKNTADITVDLTNGKLTVDNEGWYHVRLRLQYASFLIANGDGAQGRASALLYKNGSIAEWGGGTFGFLSNASGFSGGVGGMAVSSAFLIYLAAGDYIQAGFNNNTALNSGSKFLGEATGVQTYFEIALLNRSTL